MRDDEIDLIKVIFQPVTSLIERQPDYVRTDYQLLLQAVNTGVWTTVWQLLWQSYMEDKSLPGGTIITCSKPTFVQEIT